jgi:hypothetical protein
MHMRSVVAALGCWSAIGCTGSPGSSKLPGDIVAAPKNTLGIAALQFDRGENDLVVHGIDENGKEIITATVHRGMIDYVPDVGMDAVRLQGRELIVSHDGIRTLFQRPEGRNTIEHGTGGPAGVFLAFDDVTSALKEYDLTYTSETVASACSGYFGANPERADLPLRNNVYHFRNMVEIMDIDTWGGLKPCVADSDCNGPGCSGATCDTSKHRCNFKVSSGTDWGSSARFLACLDNNNHPGQWTNQTVYTERDYFYHNGAACTTTVPTAADYFEYSVIDLGPTVDPNDPSKPPPACHTYAVNDQYGHYYGGRSDQSDDKTGGGYDYTNTLKGNTESYDPEQWANLTPAVEFTPPYPGNWGTMNCLCAGNPPQPFGINGLVDTNCTARYHLGDNIPTVGDTVTVDRALGQGCDVPIPIVLTSTTGTWTVNGTTVDSTSSGPTWPTTGNANANGTPTGSNTGLAATACGSMNGQVYKIWSGDGDTHCFTVSVSKGFQMGTFSVMDAQTCGGLGGLCDRSFNNICVTGASPFWFAVQKSDADEGTTSGSYTVTVTQSSKRTHG